MEKSSVTEPHSKVLLGPRREVLNLERPSDLKFLITIERTNRFSKCIRWHIRSSKSGNGATTRIQEWERGLRNWRRTFSVNSTSMTARRNVMSTYCWRDTVKASEEMDHSLDKGEVKQWQWGALWLSTHALHRHHGAMQWHDPPMFMLALYALNICQSLITEHSRKVFYTDKGFLRALCTCLSSLFHRAVDRAVCCISAGPIPQVIVLHCNALTR